MSKKWRPFFNPCIFYYRKNIVHILPIYISHSQGCGNPVCVVIDQKPRRFKSLCSFIKFVKPRGDQMNFIQKGDCYDISKRHCKKKSIQNLFPDWVIFHTFHTLPKINFKSFSTILDYVLNFLGEYQQYFLIQESLGKGMLRKRSLESESLYSFWLYVFGFIVVIHNIHFIVIFVLNDLFVLRKCSPNLVF